MMEKFFISTEITKISIDSLTRLIDEGCKYETRLGFNLFTQAATLKFYGFAFSEVRVRTYVCTYVSNSLRIWKRIVGGRQM